MNLYQTLNKHAFSQGFYLFIKKANEKTEILLVDHFGDQLATILKQLRECLASVYHDHMDGTAKEFAQALTKTNPNQFYESVCQTETELDSDGILKITLDLSIDQEPLIFVDKEKQRLTKYSLLDELTPEMYEYIMVLDLAVLVGFDACSLSSFLSLSTQPAKSLYSFLNTLRKDKLYFSNFGWKKFNQVDKNHYDCIMQYDICNDQGVSLLRLTMDTQIKHCFIGRTFMGTKFSITVQSLKVRFEETVQKEVGYDQTVFKNQIAKHFFRRRSSIVCLNTKKDFICMFEERAKMNQTTEQVG